MVAEQFGVLEALHPGRIDLGIGRASGADPAAAERLRGYGPAGDDFTERLAAHGELWDRLGLAWHRSPQGRWAAPVAPDPAV